MPTTCKVDFENNPMKVIYAGQVLRGTVQLNLTKNKNVRGVYICISGKAHTSWSEHVPRKTHMTSNHSNFNNSNFNHSNFNHSNFRHSNSSQSNSNQHKTEYVWETYTAKEDYLNERTYFVNGEVQLMPGTYNYPFQCMLPANLPTSFEGKYGHIRYTAQVVLDIPMWTNKTFEYPFTIIKGINLNADLALRNPVVAKKVKTFGVFSTRSMIIDASTPVGGYVPGQTINLQINVNNKSKEAVSKFTVKLVKQVTYYANHGHQKLEKTTINEQDATGCDKNKNTTTIRVNLLVPSIPPTDYTSSNIIKVVYVLHVTGKLGFLHSNALLDLPIIIGSYPIQEIVPLQTVYPHQNMVQVQPSVVPTYNSSSNLQEKDLSIHQPSAPPQMPNQGVYPTLPSSTYPSAPYPFPNDEPPTYEVAINNDENDSDFQPKYPMFKRSTSYSKEN